MGHMTSAGGGGTEISGSATTIDTEDLTANRAVISNGSQKIAVSDTTSTELGYVNGVTSAIQTQLDAKQATITGSATTIDTEDLTASRAVISNGSQKIAVSDTTSTELGYVNGVTSAIQTQLDSKLSTTGIVRYRLTSDKALSNASRYTFTSGDFTAQTTNSDVATFSGTTITLKGAGTFSVKLYGYFLGDANVTAVGPQIINPPGDAGATQGAVNAIQAGLDAVIGSTVEFDLSIGSSSVANLHGYSRFILNLNYVVRMAQFSTATIETTGDEVIKLSGYIAWAGGNLKLHGTSSFQATGFTIHKVA